MAKSNVVAVGEAWRAKASERVIFHYDKNQVFWLRDADLKRVSQAGLLNVQAHALGFFNDGVLVDLLQSITRKGFEVAVAEGSALRTVTLRSTHKHAQQITGRTIGLAPELLEDRATLERLSSRFMRQPEGQALVQRLREELSKPSPSQDTLYVIQVAETIHEVDWDLTTIDAQTYEALLVAAYLSQRFLRCVLVPPRSKRAGRYRSRPQSLLRLSDAVPYGQLRLF